MLVYKVTNLINDKVYIGYTTRTLAERIRGHVYKSRYKKGKHYHYIFLDAIRKYGIDNFKWEVLHTCTNIEECCNMEIYYIKTLNSITPNGYNLTEGGNGGIQSDETKIKISLSLKEYYKLNPWTNKITTEERSKYGKIAAETRKINGNMAKSGNKQSEKSKQLMSNTKNEKNKIKWLNVKTNEIVELSLTKVAEYCNLSVGVFNHLKNGRQKQTKCGWTYLGR